MKPADSLRNAVRHRVNSACSKYLTHQFVAPFFDVHELGSKYWYDVMARAGVELVETVRVRADTRGVFLVEHPEYGRCVLKTVFAARHPGQGFANQAITGIVSEMAPSIFPCVFEATPEYTVEEYIEGRAFRKWLSTDFCQAPVRGYFAALKDWSESAPRDNSSETLSPHEIWEICRAYIVKCLDHARFFPSTSRIRSVRHFYERGDDLEAQVDWLRQAAEWISLPREMMCGDMGNVNLLVQQGTDRVFNIDYEYMGPGHRGFDCAYFLSSLSKMGDPEEVIASIKEVVLTEGYMGGADSLEFFTVFTEVLSEISRTIYGARGT